MTAGVYLPLSQVSGSLLVSTYSIVILVQSGILDPFVMTIVISLIRFVGVIVGWIRLDGGQWH